MVSSYFRLPSSFQPTDYTLRITPFIYGADPSQFFFEGVSSIIVRCSSDSDVITLHMEKLQISDADISVKHVS